MLINIILGIIIPGALGYTLFKKDVKLVLTIMPFESMLAFFGNTIGFRFELWSIYPFNLGYVAAIPFDLGLFPIVAFFMIFLIKRYKRPVIIILSFTIFLSIAEYFGLLIGRVHYNQGWNLFLTFAGYLFPAILTYYYYLLLKRNRITE